MKRLSTDATMIEPYLWLYVFFANFTENILRIIYEREGID